MMTDVEKRIWRTEELPCSSVRDCYQVMDKQKLESVKQTLEDGVCDDELYLCAALAVDEHFGAVA
jgi:hypothetical protein